MTGNVVEKHENGYGANGADSTAIKGTGINANVIHNLMLREVPITTDFDTKKLTTSVGKQRRSRVAGHIQTLGSPMTAKSRVIRGAA